MEWGRWDLGAGSAQLKTPPFCKLALGFLFNCAWFCPFLSVEDTVYWLNTETQILLLGTTCPLKPEQMWSTQGHVREPLAVVH